ncbi:MAG: SusC/RagA family TonB-linked outer membrane protein [Chitinophagaceae bacterium]|nr:SusC/RagA family TonB-linked outer membrane protein [Chitinophagaceae bacterium]
MTPKRFSLRIAVSTFFLLFLFSGTFAQDRTVTGKVTDGTNQPLSGVTVVKKGTTQGTVTDENGEYTLSGIPENTTLSFSFVGMGTRDIHFTGQSRIDVVMLEDAIGLDRVVVTALGLRREKKALGYSVGEVTSDMMNKVPQQDILGALTGKMSGVKITNTSNDINSDTYVNIRGISSLAGNNNPLVVVDGVPTGDQRVMKDINPDNIESVTVLKGPSAAALYGSRAGNGVILITSKSGKSLKKGIGVDVNIGSTYSKPYKYIDLQNRFTSGISGVLNENSYQQWNGPEEGEMAVQWNTDGEAKPLVFYDNSLRDYFRTGTEQVYDVSVNGSYDRGSFRLGFTHLDATGVYPGVELQRNGVNLAAVYNITNKVKVFTNIDITNPHSDNYPLKNGGETQYMAVYQVPPHININDLKDYWLDPDVQQRNFNAAHDNPWFAAYELKDKFDRMRVFGNVKLEYQVLPDLKIMGRYAYNSSNEKRVYRQAWSGYGGDGGGQNKPQGTFNERISDQREINTDVLISYKKSLGKFEIAPSAGGNVMTQRSYNLYAGGDPLVLPGLYTLSNVNRDGLTYYDNTYKRNIYSVYGLLDLSYDNMIFLNATARNDWSSTLPPDNWSYFYPSASLSVLLNEMLPLPSWVSLFKLRSGISQVGKDTDPYVIATVLNQGTWGTNTMYTVPGKLPNINLKPEIAKAYEIGTDISFFHNRLGADFTYYKVQNKNQILNASTTATSGYTAATINAGNVENYGVEIGLSAVPVRTKNWNWDIRANFSRERSRLKELTPGIDQFQFWGSTHVFAITQVGDLIGDIYTRDMIRVEDKGSPYYGWPLLNSNGKLQRNNDNSAMVKVGNFLHDFMVGLQTGVSYKRISLSLSIDWRQGGTYYDQTMLRLARAGKVEFFHDNANSSTFTGILSNNSFNGDNEALAKEIKAHPEIYQNDTWVGGRTQDLGGFLYSNGVYEGAFFPGVISDGAGGYIENFGGPGTRYVKAYDIFQPSGGFWDAAMRYKWFYDGSFVKLRELAVSYALPEAWSRKVLAQNISIAAFMKNLILYAANKTNQDPESIYNQNPLTGETQQGRNIWNASPVIMPVGLKLNVSF